ncbi:MAG: hypothetical protein KJ583_00960 [Nanoarchaeota archaeon]|nr:hypothetical protein [Nanoarchaeota archaeon]MBU1269222.1 hypothetical protein [Nanoarchaeota archaeon]MBU1603860.1 hypothetical protein [Nanoarchaeota archaeon]MBU2443059.1 hypothetical protein [Nanoarchaeota archaeon]
MDEVNKFVSQFTNKKINGVFKHGRKYFLIDEEQRLLSEKINRDLFSIGIFLGEKKNDFKPTPALIDVISEISQKKVFISQKAEWLFLCGRDVFEDSITKKYSDEKIVLVQNEKDENLGYGVFIKKGKEKILKNLLDKGFYLRREN